MFQLHDETRQKRYPLTGLIKEIGRTSDCDVCLPDDEQVSRVHARLDWDGTTWVLVDLGSTNGTYVNGQRVTEHKLDPGDVVEIGDTKMRFLPLDVDDKGIRTRTTKVRATPEREMDATRKSFALERPRRKKS